MDRGSIYLCVIFLEVGSIPIPQGKCGIPCSARHITFVFLAIHKSVITKNDTFSLFIKCCQKSVKCQSKSGLSTQLVRQLSVRYRYLSTPTISISHLSNINIITPTMVTTNPISHPPMMLRLDTILHKQTVRESPLLSNYFIGFFPPKILYCQPAFVSIQISTIFDRC
jgi:hypothetical protein